MIKAVIRDSPREEVLSPLLWLLVTDEILKELQEAVSSADALVMEGALRKVSGLYKVRCCLESACEGPPHQPTNRDKSKDILITNAKRFPCESRLFS